MLWLSIRFTPTTPLADLTEQDPHAWTLGLDAPPAFVSISSLHLCLSPSLLRVVLDHELYARGWTGYRLIFEDSRPPACKGLAETKTDKVRPRVFLFFCFSVHLFRCLFLVFDYSETDL